MAIDYNMTIIDFFTLLKEPSTMPPSTNKLITLGNGKTRSGAGAHSPLTLMKLPVASKVKALAFTLIELLVVIAIITILMSILLPSLQSAKALARSSVCANNLKQAGVLISVYSGDNDGFVPPANGDDLTQDPYTNSPYTHAWNRFQKTYDDPPRDDKLFSFGSFRRDGYVNDLNFIHCPEGKTLYEHPTLGETYWRGYMTYDYLGGFKTMSMIFDGAYHPIDLSRLGGDNRTPLSWDRRFSSEGNDPHGNTPNVLYVDLSVKSKKMIKLNWNSSDLVRE